MRLACLLSGTSCLSTAAALRSLSHTPRVSPINYKSARKPCARPMATAASAAASRPAALVWFRQDLRLADHEPLFRAACQMQEQQVEQQQEEEEQPLLLPFACLDERELAPPERSQLGLPLLGPHRLR